MFDFNEIFNILDGEEFEERPVPIETFVQSEEYCNLPPLSDYQYAIIKASSQIYKHKTLVALYGEEDGNRRYRQTCNEVIAQLGKGSGKDYSSTIACAYIVYLLLCLKDPAAYYGKPPGDTIDILNVAVNADQARSTFFKGFVNRIERCAWFQGRFNIGQSKVEFEKSITLYSGHSEREAWEGFNFIYVVLDEISAFQLESTTGHAQAKTAQAIYDMYRASVDSRFPDVGKVVLLSFPRFKNDFIQQRYNDVIAEKEVVIRRHLFKLDPDLPDGQEENEFMVEWEEDHILSYRIPRVFALRRPTWEVNPTRKIEDFAVRFFSNRLDALARFACMPPDAVDAFFKDRNKIEVAFQREDPLDENNAFKEWFRPDPEKIYFIHVDLARKHDHCAVALAHVEKWERRRIGADMTEAAPVIIVDLVRFWTPNPTKNVDFAEVRQFIVSLRQRGFNIKLVTFDRWESEDMMSYLNSVGMKSERLSVAKKHYEDMAMVVGEERLHGPRIQLLIDELLQLMIMNNDKVDHPRKGSKDLSDAVCGAIFNSIAHTPRDSNETIEVVTLSSMTKEERINTLPDGVIRAPKSSQPMPPDLEDWLASIKVL